MLQVLEENVINSKPSVLGVISENIAGAYAAAARFNYNNGNGGVLLHVNLLLASIATSHKKAFVSQDQPERITVSLISDSVSLLVSNEN